MIAAPASDPRIRRDANPRPMGTSGARLHRGGFSRPRACNEPIARLGPRTHRGFRRPTYDLASNDSFAANRLSSVTDPAGVSTMEYDAAGRFTKRTEPNGVVMTYAYDNVNRCSTWLRIGGRLRSPTTRTRTMPLGSGRRSLNWMVRPRATRTTCLAGSPSRVSRGDCCRATRRRSPTTRSRSRVYRALPRGARSHK